MKGIFYYCTDDNYVMPTCVSASSLLREFSGRPRPEVHIYIEGNVSSSNRIALERFRRKMARFGDVEIKDLPPLCEGALYVANYLTKTAYQRMVVPSLLDREVERAIYLDCDTVVREDVSPLLMIDLEGCTLGACVSMSFPHVSRLGALDYCFRDFGFEEDAPYFNSGLLVVDVGQFREKRVAEKVQGFCRRYSNVMNFGDQEALNAVCKGDWKRIDERWNWSNAYPEGAKGMAWEGGLARNAWIRHFVGSMKPWETGLLGKEVLEYRWRTLRSGFFSFLGFWRDTFRFYRRNLPRAILQRWKS